jgi:hypothetical protein
MICGYCGKPANNFEPLVGYMIGGFGVEWHQHCIDQWENEHLWMWEGAAV